jgi:DNA-binding MarR family transcriptional regulator
MSEQSATIAAGTTPSLMGSIVHQLGVTSHQVARLCTAEFEGALKISTSEWRVLAAVSDTPDVSPSRVADVTKMDKVRVSRAVDSLVRSGLLKMTTDTKDGRIRRLTMTAKGKGVHAKAAELAKTHESMLLSGFTSEEVRKLGSLLARLSNYATQAGADGARAA